MSSDFLKILLVYFIISLQTFAQSEPEIKFQKKILLEHFTTQLCSNCPFIHDMLYDLLSAREDVIWVSHHTGYKEDIYTIDESVEYKIFYKSTSSYAPAVMVDRTNMFMQGAMNNQGNPSAGPVFFPYETALIQNILEYQLRQKVSISVDIEHHLDIDSRELNIHVSGHVDKEELDKDLLLFVFLTEDGLVGTQYGAANLYNYVHNHVIREVVTETWGDTVFLGNGGYSMNYELILDNEWKAENMKIIAFVSRLHESNVNGWNVYNANEVQIEFEEQETTSYNNLSVDNVYAYITNCYIKIHGEFTGYSLYDISGNKISESKEIPDLKLRKGMYIIKIHTPEKEFIQKVIIP